MRKNQITGLLYVAMLFVFFTLTSCGSSKDDFAPQLAEDIVKTWKEGAQKNKGKEITFFSDLNYEDIGKGISLHKKGMNLLDIAGQIAGRAEGLRMGFDTGLDMGGYIDLKDYDTGFGEFDNQKLGWEFNSNSNAIVCHVKGILTNEDHPESKPLQVDYKFQVDNDSDGLSTSTIKMLGGEIKDGDEVIKVDQD